MLAEEKDQILEGRFLQRLAEANCAKNLEQTMGQDPFLDRYGFKVKFRFDSSVDLVIREFEGGEDVSILFHNFLSVARISRKGWNVPIEWKRMCVK